MTPASSTLPLRDRLITAPLPYDEDAASRLEASLSPALFAEKTIGNLITGVAGCSPYLARLMMRRPETLDDVLNKSPDETVQCAVKALWAAASTTDPAAQMKAMRDAKSMVALGLALAEIGGALPTMEAAAHLSTFADAACGAALRIGLRGATSKGFAPVDPDAPEQQCGVAVIAMGKLGAGELNYSSDIDLVIIYDPDAPALGGAASAKGIAIAAVKTMVALLSNQTADGYVFRTDLRLRPDPGVTAAAVSINAAESYYEAHGQNWERAAYIKARSAAGDIALGDLFLKRLRPFIWRKYLDYAAIEDIQSIRRQMHTVQGGGDISFAGHDLKTGRGGIREIEFLAQTQQLILGGKNESLRIRPTLSALSKLTALGVLDHESETALREAYIYLRCVEHRLQMVTDEQTHAIPENPDHIQRLAMFLGAPSSDDFRRRLIEILTATHQRFSTLFDVGEPLAGAQGVLSFTGVEPNKDTLRSLKEMGFEEPATIAMAIADWHRGALRSTRTIRGRELLTKLTPALLESLARASRPDEAFAALDGFLRRLPAGVQIFSLWIHHPGVFDEIIRIMTVSPWLGRSLVKRPHLIEAMTENAWPPAPSPPTALAALLTPPSDQPDIVDFEDDVNVIRRWASEENFTTAAELVVGRIDAHAAAERFSDVAEIVIKETLTIARREVERQYGVLAGDIAVVGFGRLGARAMTAASDIDVVFVYQAKGDVESDGNRPIDAVTYFSRLVRRFLTALSTPTAQGALYEVDMALRPSGRAGPAAVSIDAFRRYYLNDAWTWERMALVKSRVIGVSGAGAPGLEEAIGEVRRLSLAKPMAADALFKDVREMRERLLREKPPGPIWDLKRAHGGPTDIDFILQALTLRQTGAETSEKQPFWPSTTMALLNNLAVGEVIAPEDVDVLVAARDAFESAIQLSRAATGGVLDPNVAGAALKERMAVSLSYWMARHGGATIEGFKDVEAFLERKAALVRQVFERVVN